MSASTLLLRVLLCLSLILNGSGYAFAATGMELAHLSGAAAHDVDAAAAPHMGMADTSSSDGRMPCHEPDTEAGQPASKHPGSDNPPGDDDDADCCPSSHCACAQQLTATVPQIVARPAVVAHAAGIRTAARAHPAPPVPHLIRPPIG